MVINMSIIIQLWFIIRTDTIETITSVGVVILSFSSRSFIWTQTCIHVAKVSQSQRFAASADIAKSSVQGSPDAIIHLPETLIKSTYCHYEMYYNVLRTTYSVLTRLSSPVCLDSVRQTVEGD